MWCVGNSYKVILWYRYCPIQDVSKLIETLSSKCKFLGLLGRILISTEGMNGTLAGSCEDIDAFIQFFTTDMNFHHIDWKYHVEHKHCEYLPFLQLSVREVQEIISCGLQRNFIDNFIQYDATSYGGIEGSGVHLSADEFHDMMEREKDNCLILDIRNEFEYDIGHFHNAIGVGTFTYAETFNVLDNILADEIAKANETKDDDTNSTKKILMYCTGGIRCEKASAYLRAKWLDNVYQVR